LSWPKKKLKNDEEKLLMQQVEQGRRKYGKGMNGE
jgi:hypothetical protein